jgi:AcrR family transcriptional regulator
MVYFVTVPTKATSAAPRKRRSPITRAEGEQRLINAALELIQTKPFSEVGVREIAERADVNHGFVHTWFGSKNDLLLAVVKKLIIEFGEKASTAAPGTLAIDAMDPSAVLLVRLIMWLDLEGVDIKDTLGNLPVITALSVRYQEQNGLSPHLARIAAIQAVSFGVGAASFARILDIKDSDEITEVFTVWRHIVGLLAKYPPA